jgi:predicted ester cyclase
MPELRKIVERHYQHFKDGTLKDDVSNFSEDVETSDPNLGTVRGIEPFLMYGLAFKEAFPDGEMQIESSLETANTIAVQGLFAGTNTGALQTPDGNSVPPTGHRVEFRFADFFTVESGLITNHAIYFDMMGFMRQLGMVPEPVAA